MSNLPLDGIHVYTDGSQSWATKAGGWAYCVVIAGEIERSLSGAQANTTNNRMELAAMLNALARLAGLYTGHTLHVITDSRYCINAVTGLLQRRKAPNGTVHKPVKNYDLIAAIANQCAKREVVFHWVRGHNGDVYNSVVDQLAVSAREEFERKNY